MEMEFECMECSGMELDALNAMEWNTIGWNAWNGTNEMERNAIQWNGIDEIEIGITEMEWNEITEMEWNGMITKMEWKWNQ
jgi:hypothetical protein